MKKQEYLDRLGELLACLPAERVAEAQAFYAEAIDDRMEDGMSEADAVAQLDAPGVEAERILDELPAVPRAVVKTRRKSRVLMWVLIILGSPLWLALAIAFASVALAVYVCIWIMAACIWVVALAFAVLLPVGVVAAWWGLLAGTVPFALGMLGIGLVCGGIAALVFAVAGNVSRQLARLSVLWVRKAVSPFVNPDRGRRDGSVPTAPSAA